MRILHIDFHDDGRSNRWRGYMTPTSGYAYAEGMRQLGHEVHTLDYTDHEIFPDESFDLVWIAGQQLRHVAGYEIKRIRRRCAKVPTVIFYTDLRHEPEPWVEWAAPITDMIFYPVGGWHLRQLIERGGFRQAAFLPVGIYDPDAYVDFETMPERTIPWFYSGSDIGLGDGCRRHDCGILRELDVGLVHPGMFGSPEIGGMEHLRMLYRAQRALAVSHYHAGWDKYTSTRTWLYMACGIDVAVRWFDGCETMLHPDTDVYRSADELGALKVWRSDSRVRKLRKWVRDRYLGDVIVQAALDMLNDSDTGWEWEEVYVA